MQLGECNSPLNDTIMKNTILTFCILFGLSIFSYGQTPNRDRVDALRVAFITERLELTPEEAQQFWPVFNKFKEEGKAMRRSYRIPKSADEMTPTEAENFLDGQIEKVEKQLDFRKKYFVALKEVLPAKKIVQLLEAEKAFKKKLLDTRRERRRF